MNKNTIKWVDNDNTEHEGKILFSKNEFDIINCKNCGFIHVVPIPSEKFLSEYYAKIFVKNRPVEFYKKMEEDFPWLEILYNEKYDLFDKNLSQNRKSILDVGSGLGFFLKVGRDRGWNTLGIEPSIESVEYAERFGLKIVNEYLNEENFEQLGCFDVIHMHEVLEHLPDPDKIIRLAKKMLNPGGLICIVSPNDFNPLQKAFIANNEKILKWWVSPPEHINYFNFKSATKLLEKHGINILKQTSTFPLELFLLMGDNYIENRKVGKMIHSKRKTLEINLLKSGNEKLRRKIYASFANLNLGREFVLVGKINKQ